LSRSDNQALAVIVAWSGSRPGPRLRSMATPDGELRVQAIIGSMPGINPETIRQMAMNMEAYTKGPEVQR
jgi:hypothetical protein